MVKGRVPMKLKITVHGVAYEVEVEILDAEGGFPAVPEPLPRTASQAPAQTVSPHSQQGAHPSTSTQSRPVTPAGSSSVTSPIAGNVIEVKCKVGDTVKKDQDLLIVEAMKMETAIAAPADGKIKSVDVAVGDAVREGQSLVQFE